MSEGRIEDRELENLMLRYQQAEPEALEELVRRISPPLLRYFNASPGSRNQAEDLVQDCWIRIHRSRHTYRPAQPVMPWIYAIARHTRLDAYRKRSRLAAREVLVAQVPETAAPSAPPHRDETLAALVDALPDSQREVIVMLKVAGMSIEEVARATSSTSGAIKQKAHRAYTALRKALAKQHEP